MENLLALKSLVVALQEGSLSGAARRLGINQPAVSQQIATLEQGYGVDLVLRGRNGIRPTEAGTLAAAHAAVVLARLAVLKDELSALRTSDAGRLGVACPQFLAQTVLLPVLAGLRRDHPRLKIDLKTSDAVEDLASIGADLAIRPGNAGEGTGTVRRLGEIEMVLVASPTYLDREGRPDGITDLVRLDYVQYKDDPEETSILMADGREAAIRVAFAAQLPNLMLHAVLGHLGFAKMPRFFVREHLAQGALVELLREPPAAKPVYLVRAPGTQGASRRAAIFTERLVAELAAVPGFRLAADLRPLAEAALANPPANPSGNPPGNA